MLAFQRTSHRTMTVLVAFDGVSTATIRNHSPSQAAKYNGFQRKFSFMISSNR